MSVLTFRKTDRFAPFREHSQFLARYLRPQRGRVLTMAVLLLLGIALQIASPQIIRIFLDTAQSGGSLAALRSTALLFISFALLQQGLKLAAGYVSQQVSWSATNRLRADLTLHCLRLDMPFHKVHTPGELIERIDGDVSVLANFFSAFIVQVAGNILLVLGILVMLFLEDPRVGLGITLYTVLTLLALGRIQRLAVPRWVAERQTAADLTGYLEERIASPEDLRAVGAENYALRRLLLLLQVYLHKRRAAFVAGSLSYNLTSLLYVVGYAIGLALGVYLFAAGQATLGAAYLITHYVGMLSDPLQAIREQFQDLQQAEAGIERIQGLLALQPQAAPPAPAAGGLYAGAGQLPIGPLPVIFENVSFHYDDLPVVQLAPLDREDEDEPEEEEAAAAPEEELDAENVLEQVSFDLSGGQVLGILGRTGSGKTTLTRLLFRLYDPTTGCIRLGGQDLRALALSDLRGRVGLVTQDVQLFQASVRDNLTFFDPDLPDQRLETILRELQLWDWVESLPLGLNTRLGTGGQGLSAGEAQLLAFARVFLKAPGLVVLDEASSRLDPATETRMERAIDRLFHGRTGVIIAHRLRTVQRADAILILEGGRVVEFGLRAALAADPHSRFAALLRTGLEEALA